jgi:hypothetical protein
VRHNVERTDWTIVEEDEMRKVVAAEYVTVDGVITDPGGVGEIEQGGWSNRYFNDELASTNPSSCSRVTRCCWGA